jgi:AcrR family transcriptional regulator
VQKFQGQSDDVRVQRTRELLVQALFELTVEKGFAAVTVSDIAERARVNRSTFYRHYLDKYDLLSKYLDELQAQISDAALQVEKASDKSSEKIPAGLLLLIKHVRENADFYRVMLGKKGDQVFTHRFRQLSEQRYRYIFSRSGKSVDLKSSLIEMKLSYISSAAVGTILWWLENKQPITPEQLATWLGQLSMTAAEITLQELGASVT